MQIKQCIIYVRQSSQCNAKQSKAKQSKAKQSKAKQSKAKQSKAKQSKAKQSKAKQSNALPGGGGGAAGRASHALAPTHTLATKALTGWHIMITYSIA
jgi:hypothetical protein